MHFLTLSLLAATALAAPAPTLKARSAASEYPFASDLGTAIEGVSVDVHGTIHAVNQTHFISLTTGDVLLKGEGGDKSHFASSRFTRSYGALVGDAAAHKIWKAPSKAEFAFNEAFLQPNDFTVSGSEKRFYLSGMNYTANTGDVWVHSRTTDTTTKVDLPAGKMFRTNGIELSPDDSTLYVTSAENSADATQVLSAKVWKFAVDAATGIPSGGEVAIDLYATLEAMGLDPKKAGMDPDGMRMDAQGTLFMTLNAFGKVLMWDTKGKTEDARVIELETVAFPTNLELGGKDGKTLVVVGRCKDLKTSCVDSYPHNVSGRAWTNLSKRQEGCDV